jgi:outer membrane immunogenic protein
MKQQPNLAIAPALACAVALFLTTTIANAGAERLSSKEVEPAPVAPSCEAYDWTGFYVGVNLGGELGNYDFSRHFTDTTSTASFENNAIFIGEEDTLVSYTESSTFLDPGQSANRNTSFLGGGQLGFQKQWGHFVVGLEGDFDAAGSKGSTSFTSSHSDQLENFEEEFTTGGGVLEQERTVTGNTQLTTRRRAEENWMASARLRVGYACGRCLIYATGGGAFANIETTAIDTETTNFTVLETTSQSSFSGAPTTSNTLNFVAGPFTETNISKSSDMMVGWTAGAGVAWAATDCINLGIEYRHTDLGNNTFGYTSHNSAIFPGNTKVDFQSDMVTVRLNFMIGRLWH